MKKKKKDKNKTWKLKKKHKKYFKKRVKFWHKKLGLTQKLYIRFAPLTDTTIALSVNDKTNHVLFIALNVSFEYTTKNIFKSLDRTAFHETFEGGYFGEIHNLATNLYQKDYVSMHSHRAVNAAVNNLYPVLKDLPND